MADGKNVHLLTYGAHLPKRQILQGMDPHPSLLVQFHFSQNALLPYFNFMIDIRIGFDYKIERVLIAYN